MDAMQGVNAVFSHHPEVKLAYLFGSRASGDTGPLSDYDFGVYADTPSKQESAKLKLVLMDEISHALGTDKIDVVMMDTERKPELNHAIIYDGKLIYEIEPYRVIVEPRILSEYFDFRETLRRHNLTRA